MDLQGRRLKEFGQRNNHALSIYPYSDLMQRETGIVSGLRTRTATGQRMALKVLVEGQLYHRRTLDSVNVVRQMSNRICSSRNPTLKISSRMHEHNLPFQVFCAACRPIAPNEGPTLFYVLKQRNLKLNDASNLVPESVFLRQHLMYNTSDAGQIYAMERHIDEEIEDLHETDVNPPLQRALGELRVNPALSPALLNGLSTVCARDSDRQENAHPLDVLFQMDTLVHPTHNANKKHISIGVEKEDSIKTGKIRNEGDCRILFMHPATVAFIRKHLETDRFKIGDLEPFDAKKQAKLMPVYKEHLNLKLDLRWEDWSCCSACCCSKQVCGFKMARILCEQMDSFRTRLGYVSFLKIHSNKPLSFLNLLHEFYNRHYQTHKVEAEHLKDALDNLNENLDTQPYATQGIPVFSTLLQSSVPNRILIAFLNEVVF